MHRRTLILATASLASSSLAWCLDGRFGGQNDGNDRHAPGSSNHRTAVQSDIDHTSAIDPDATYVRDSPEGYFSALGPLNTDLDGVAIHGYDLVAYYEQDRAVNGSPVYEVEYAGATFRFFNEDHWVTFAKTPAAYLPAYGGYCSLGVGNGYKDGMHAEAFDVIDGDLYFNLTPAIHEGWLRSYEDHIERADANWPEIKDSTDPAVIGPGF